MEVAHFLHNFPEALALLRAGAAVLPPEAGHLVVRAAVPRVAAVDRPQQLQRLLVPPLPRCSVAVIPRVSAQWAPDLAHQELWRLGHEDEGDGHQEAGHGAGQREQPP